MHKRIDISVSAALISILKKTTKKNNPKLSFVNLTMLKECTAKLHRDLNGEKASLGSKR